MINIKSVKTLLLMRMRIAMYHLYYFPLGNGFNIDQLLAEVSLHYIDRAFDQTKTKKEQLLY